MGTSTKTTLLETTLLRTPEMRTAQIRHNPTVKYQNLQLPSLYPISSFLARAGQVYMATRDKIEESATDHRWEFDRLAAAKSQYHCCFHPSHVVDMAS